MMKCPNCGKEMVSGIIESAREIMWCKEGEKKEKRISSRLFMTSKAFAERCEECGIVVVKEEQ
jgi:uncharacterized Zn finger protein (UPF0148 family)